MHCLPAYRGLEVTASVIDGPRSRVIRQGHNRLRGGPPSPSSSGCAREREAAAPAGDRPPDRATAGRQPAAPARAARPRGGADDSGDGVTRPRRARRDQGARRRSDRVRPAGDRDRSDRPVEQLRRVLGEWVADVAVSGNIVIVRTPPGCAHVVASALDRSAITGLLGTVAGDDTLMCVAAGRHRRRAPRRRPARVGRLRTPSDAMSGSTLWHGRFGRAPADSLMAFTGSLHVDRRLWRDDMAGSRAHVRGLTAAGLLEPGEGDAVLAALDTVEEELAGDAFEFPDSDEDIHTAVERRVTELAGAAGAKLHTARSRNDQVATDLRLWCKRELSAIAARTAGAAASAARRAEADTATYLPGTPTCSEPSRAPRPSLPGPRVGVGPRRRPPRGDRRPPRRLAARRRSLAGTSLPIDPAAVAADLGFARRSTTPSTPSVTATSSPRRCSTSPCSASTCRGLARSSCCGRVRSSGSPGWTTPTRPVRRCCRRRRTRTSPSSPGQGRSA